VAARGMQKLALAMASFGVTKVMSVDQGEVQILRRGIFDDG
jgi:hypothetical protein